MVSSFIGMPTNTCSVTSSTQVTARIFPVQVMSSSLDKTPNETLVVVTIKFLRLDLRNGDTNFNVNIVDSLILNEFFPKVKLSTLTSDGS